MTRPAEYYAKMLQSPKCEAIARNSGKRCRMPAMKYTNRCCYHGGRGMQNKYLGLNTYLELQARRRATMASPELRAACPWFNALPRAAKRALKAAWESRATHPAHWMAVYEQTRAQTAR